MLKKIISCLVTGAIFVCSGILGVSAEDSEEKGLYIKTESISQDVSAYAQDMFSHFKIDTLRVIGLTDGKIDDYLLSKGIKVNLLDNNDYEKYYFPVICNNQIVALLCVNKDGDDLSYTLSNDDVAESLNTISVSAKNAVDIYVSSYTIYAVNNDGITTLSEDIYATEDSKIKDKKELQNLSVNQICRKRNNIVNILNKDYFYDVRVKQSEMTRAVVGRSCDGLPCVPNKTVVCDDGKRRYVCWACSSASMIEYINNGNQSSVSNATDIRDELIEVQKEADTDDCKTFIEEYTDISLERGYNALSWEKVKEQILFKDTPIYMHLVNYSNYEGHATVLCGYDYDDEDDYGRYNQMYIMDPNIKGKWRITSFGSTYSPSGSSIKYSWIGSLYKG